MASGSMAWPPILSRTRRIFPPKWSPTRAFVRTYSALCQPDGSAASGLAPAAIARFAAAASPRLTAALKAASGLAAPAAGLLLPAGAFTAAFFVGLVAAAVFGFQAAFFAFPLAYARTYGASWRLALTLGIVGEAILIGLFDTIIHIVWPEPLLQVLLGIGEGVWY